MIENTYLERERMGSSRANVRIDLVTYPVCGAYGWCSRELFRATARARDVDLWVPSDGYPSYVSIPGLGWSGTGHWGYSRALRTDRKSYYVYALE